MTPSEVIQKINQAMCDDNLGAAEKALEEYVLGSWEWYFNTNWSFSKNEDGNYIDIESGENNTIQEIYKLFTNQSEKTIKQ